MHILIIASWYKSNDTPTAGSFIEEQARMLQAAGHKVSVIHPFINGTFLETLKGAKTIYYQENDNDILTAKVSTNVVIPKVRTHSYLRLYRKTKQYYDEYVVTNGIPDIIHSHALFMGGIIGYFLSRQNNIPQLHTEHTSGLIFNSKQYTKSDMYLLKKVYSSCKKVFFVSDFAKEKGIINNLNYANIEVVNNLVSNAFFNYSDPPSFLKFKYIAIGNLIKRKQFDFLLYAWQEFIKTNTKSLLTIAGIGPEEANLTDLIKKLGLSQSVVIIPRLSRSEVKEQIDLHHVLLSSSKIETFGLTVAEAIASGRPVVVTDSGGIRDIVDDTNGIITDFSKNSFVNALIQIQENYKTYNLKEISSNIQKKLGEKAIYDKLKDYYIN